jgi:outer membrane biosynthesis protein TonB
MRTGVTISCLGHAAILAWSVVAFAAKPNESKPVDAMPVDIVTASELSQVRAGIRNAPNFETPKPKPMVEKVAEPKPAEDTIAKVDTRAIKAASEPPPAPAPAPAPKPPAAAQKKPPEPKRDLIAEALKKDEAHKPEPKRPEPKAAAPAPKAAPPAPPMFDAKQLQALLDKRAPQRLAATGEALNNDVSLGSVQGAAAQLSQSEIDALRKRIEECWSPPIGFDNNTKVQVVLRVLFNTDGSVAKPPDLVSGTASPLGPAMAESAKRAILRCQPFKMLKPEHYDQWKDIEITFDPQHMNRG